MDKKNLQNNRDASANKEEKDNSMSLGQNNKKQLSEGQQALQQNQEEHDQDIKDLQQEVSAFLQETRAAIQGAESTPSSPENGGVSDRLGMGLDSDSLEEELEQQLEQLEERSITEKNNNAHEKQEHEKSGDYENQTIYKNYEEYQKIIANVNRAFVQIDKQKFRDPAALQGQKESYQKAQHIMTGFWKLFERFIGKEGVASFS